LTAKASESVHKLTAGIVSCIPDSINWLPYNAICQVIHAQIKAYFFSYPNCPPFLDLHLHTNLNKAKWDF
jgi:hypothetical protein